MTGPTRRDTTNCWVSQRKVRQNGTLRHLHCPAVCPGQSWRWALLKKNTQQQILSKKDVSAVQVVFHWLGKDPNQSIKKWLLTVLKVSHGKKNETHNATLAETIIATETLGSENKFPFGKTSRQCYVSFSECTSVGRGSREVFPPGFAFCSLPIAREPLSTKTIHSRWLNHPFQKNMISPIFTGKKTTTITL